ncbi:MAG: hypothetical protein ACJ8M4_10265 [Chthoniobacterales bacterium]
MTRKSLILFLAAAIFIAPHDISAGSVGDFFKALGNSIAHPGQGKKKQTAPVKKSSSSKETSAQPADFPPSPPPAPSPLPSPTPTLPQVPVKVALVSPRKNTRRDLPYAIPVPNRPGFVTSPFAPKAGYVDVRGFPSSTEVTDPYSGKIFLTP